MKTWMTLQQQKDYDTICALIDTVRTPKQFYEVCKKINKYDCDVVNAAREDKHFFNSAQFAE
jgi:hypothetical protein